jgi:hypothetical protein
VRTRESQLRLARVDLRVGPTTEGGRLRFSWALTYRVTTVVGAGALAALAFSQRSQGWDIVGAVLVGSAIADVILLIVVAWFRWRHRTPS